MKLPVYVLTLIACSLPGTQAAGAAEPPTQRAAEIGAQSAKTAAETQAQADGERAKLSAEAAQRDGQRAKVDAEAARRDGQRAKIDAEAARRELEQMREQMRDLSKRMAELSTTLGDVGPRTYAYHYFGDPERGLVGVVLGKDAHGLRVSAVTPGGPADKAGVKNGDVIVVVNGVDVAKTATDPKAPQPLRNLTVGEEVKLTLLRDGRQIDVALKAERREPFNFTFAIDDAGDLGKLGELKKLDELRDLGAQLPPDFAQRIERQVERATHEAERQAERAMQSADVQREQSVRIAERATEQAQRALQRVSLSMPWWGLNLTNLNPDLGAYFGTEHGVLVLSADADASKTLKSGDVLVAINGSRVERPEDALRLLREQPGKNIKVDVLRQRKPQTLSMRAPEFKTMFVPAPPIAPVAPAPPPLTNPPRLPAPPAPPSAPAAPRSLPAPPAPAAPAAPAAPTNDDEAPPAAPRAASARIA